MSETKEIDELLTAILGSTIKKRRQELGYSMEKLAQLSAISRSMLGLIESGKTTPSVGILWKLSRSLRTPIADLVPETRTLSPKLIKWKESKVLTPQSKVGLQIRDLSQEKMGRLAVYHLSIPQGKHLLPSAFEAKVDQSIVVLDGEVEFLHNAKVYHLEAGDRLVLNTFEPVSFQVAKQEQANLLWISPLSPSDERRA
ncbi:DNA-binding helix-turn-helix protein [Leptospira ryugenii]|uniref:DNA-binding helix-turn-helix protein n=1 Tax=Leptospira ryugenii TaxID=1917863 RepID=A0A2P2E1C6_9LEPT|nr:helix-turn-helix transcriptional regulator [Leptospira ryugenii]GBF50679.1 DNA-binding helix-turn-helix protein [Leptospira ryugenii]